MLPVSFISALYSLENCLKDNYIPERKIPHWVNLPELKQYEKNLTKNDINKIFLRIYPATHSNGTLDFGFMPYKLSIDEIQCSAAKLIEIDSNRGRIAFKRAKYSGIGKFDLDSAKWNTDNHWIEYDKFIEIIFKYYQPESRAKSREEKYILTEESSRSNDLDSY